MPHRDELKGTFKQVKGQAKQKIAEATGNQRLHEEGVADEATGEVQEGFGKVKREMVMP